MAGSRLSFPETEKRPWNVMNISIDPSRCSHIVCVLEYIKVSYM